MDERRSEFRKPVSHRGLIVVQGLDLGCVIADVSAGGCKVKLDRPLSLPTEVTLIDLKTATGHEARVMWSKGGEIGLKLMASSGLSGLTPARFAAARQVWLKHGGR